MLMKDDKKKMATLIVAKMKKGDDKMRPAPEHEGAEMADSDEKSMVADEIMEAIKKSDVSALKESLKSFIEMCSNEEYKEESEEDDSY